MITGYNTDVEYDGRVYHVQTEDKGRGNPVIESLVYTSGEILTTRRSSYAELFESGQPTEAELQKRMEVQHQQLIRDIRNGVFDPDGPKPVGYNIVSNRSLDEVVLTFLCQESGPRRIRLEPEQHVVLIAGEQVRVRFKVVVDDDDRPVAGAVVRAKLISTAERPKTLFRGSTENDGKIEVELDLPAFSEDTDSAVLFQVEAAGRNAEMKQFVRRAAPPPNPPDASDSGGTVAP
jgi:hypothetical protein